MADALTAAKIAEFEEELKNTKYNKRTQGAVGILKAKIAKLKEDARAKASKKINTDSFAIKKSGDATAVIVGFPSVGKSTLLNAITKADSAVAAYAFTTINVIPGLLDFGGIRIQIFDVPGLIEGASEGKGRGKEVLGCISVADLIILIIDATDLSQYHKIMSELYESRIRLNQKRPDVKIVRKNVGGLHISSIPLKKIDKQTIINIMREFRASSADMIIREDIDVDQLIDLIENNRYYIPGIVVLNKADLLSPSELERAKLAIRPDVIISALNKKGLEELKEKIIEKLERVRVFCKEAGKDANMERPMVLKKSATLKDACISLHRDFVTKFKYARVWGKSVKFDGQRVLNIKHQLKDYDIVEIHTR